MTPAATSGSRSLFEIEVQTLTAETTTLARYRGHVLLIVNVASQCGFTPQCQDLETLYRRFRERGLVVLGFPCNQFGRQEPGSEAEIARFCTETYDVTFPMFGKVDVNGPGAHPIYQQLKTASPGVFGLSAIKWNFTKFLVGRSGRVIRRYAPQVRPTTIVPDIEAALEADPSDE